MKYRGFCGFFAIKKVIVNLMFPCCSSDTTLPCLQVGRGQHVRKEGIEKMTNVVCLFDFQYNLNVREIQLQ